MSFDTLPDIVWVKVFSYLTIAEKYKLSLLNSQLYQVFLHPHLWQDISITLFGLISPTIKDDYYREEYHRVLKQDQYIKLICKFGCYIRNLKIIIVGEVVPKYENITDVLKCIVECCQSLDSIYLKIGKWISRNKFYHPSYQKDNQVLFSLSQIIENNKNRLKKFNLESWPILTDNQVCLVLEKITVDPLLIINQTNNTQSLSASDILLNSFELDDPFSYMSQNSNSTSFNTKQLFNLKDFYNNPNEWTLPLSNFSLFYPTSLICDTWIPLNCRIPSQIQTYAVIENLSHLEALRIHISCLTIALLDELSSCKRQVKLKLLAIFLITETSSYADSVLMNISELLWKKLTDHSPFVQLEVMVGNSISSTELIKFLKPEAPLTSLKFSTYSRYGIEVLKYVAVTHGNHMLELVDHSYGCSDLIELESFVIQCVHLEKLTYFGEIRDSLVFKLIDLKGKHWKNFQINIDKVLITYPSFCEDFSSEDVLVKSNSGEYLLTSLLPENGFYFTDDSESYRRYIIEEIEKKASKILRFSWNPLRYEKFLPKIFN